MLIHVVNHRKKQKRTMVPEDIVNDSQMEQNDIHNNDVLYVGKNIEEEKVLDVRSNLKRERRNAEKITILLNLRRVQRGRFCRLLGAPWSSA